VPCLGEFVVRESTRQGRRSRPWRPTSPGAGRLRSAVFNYAKRCRARPFCDAARLASRWG
jgi:hypothetical protein